ncbi:D-alanyl-D-alanine carboxypeptidase/D-alanyl-D-alanine endopeptidase [Gluconacetobacter asukensis]|uniref:D-alanyl-D-alanine carboxypeptidase/D-alanyl-D-alanine-endopeptidase n=1 Tax=Gluconacetobacter asukensis TaxID=1017181 RepID=A0A7W4P0I2_9PROT|nr:D-alanyl-D-alanine carboxypeptidase/D-alanyl-D-alanine-endopeptidase [Gluconacetobacter asukensis]MBB2172962.1 D-alanyl-D-alanine carboxypeptidase/D-alanyl-D-alanine-endopeptidase [Gluconacetobacter asukensis]
MTRAPGYTRHNPGRVASPSRLAALRLCLPMLLSACTLSPPDIPAPGGTAALTGQIHAILDTPALGGTRWGLLVTDMDGKEILAINPDQRFIPASNTKMFTTAAALASLPGLSDPDRAGGASVRLVPHEGGASDVVLIGAGDARLSDRPDCQTDCLSALADATAAAGIRRVHDVMGDDRLFPDERWGPGWSWNTLQTRSGAAVSALTLDDNVAALSVAPGSAAGSPPSATWKDGETYLRLDNQAVTVGKGKTDLRIERQPGARWVRLYGIIAAGAPPEILGVGIEDPADFAAWHFRRLLEARGIAVEGGSGAWHRPLTLTDDAQAPPPFPVPPAPVLTRLTPPPLADDIRHLLKVSQNLHAEIMLRRLGLAHGTGSAAQGVAQRDAILAAAGVPRTSFSLADGSGMSTYNRVTPRAVAALLLWANRQPWGQAWRQDLPVAGEDGTLARRFAGTALADKLFAKTGTLNATHALSGYMIAASGRMLIVSFFANDVPPDVGRSTAAMDKALLTVAAAE